MAEAMIRGVLDTGLMKPEAIIASNPRPRRCAELAERFGVRTTTLNSEAARAAGIVVLAVKPQVLPRVIADLRGVLRSEQLVISIVAGARMATLEEGLRHAAIVRAMPNTPAQIGYGMTVWIASPAVTPEQLAQTRALLGALGQELVVEEEKFIDMATAVSASGPAFVFLVMEALIDAAVHLGFPRQMAHDLVTQMMLGAVVFAQRSGRHPAELRNMVTSPGGTSAEGLYQLEKGSIRTVLSRAVYAAYERAVKLGEATRHG